MNKTYKKKTPNTTKKLTLSFFKSSYTFLSQQLEHLVNNSEFIRPKNPNFKPQIPNENIPFSDKIQRIMSIRKLFESLLLIVCFFLGAARLRLHSIELILPCSGHL